MVLAYRQETREYMNLGVPSVCLALAKKVAWLSWKHCMCAESSECKNLLHDYCGSMLLMVWVVIKILATM